MAPSTARSQIDERKTLASKPGYTYDDHRPLRNSYVLHQRQARLHRRTGQTTERSCCIDRSFAAWGPASCQLRHLQINTVPVMHTLNQVVKIVL